MLPRCSIKVSSGFDDEYFFELESWSGVNEDDAMATNEWVWMIAQLQKPDKTDKNFENTGAGMSIIADKKRRQHSVHEKACVEFTSQLNSLF